MTEHVEMARRIAGKMARRLPAALADDVQSAALLGLVEAASRFDIGRGESFTAFAAKRVRGAVLDELRRGDVLPRRVRQTARRTRDAVRRLEHELGRAPREEEVAGRLGVGVEEYRDRIAGLDAVEVVSLDDVSAVVSAGGEDPAEKTERARASDRVARARKRLDRREALVLSMLYDEGKTLAEIGRALGVTESRACQLHTRALRRVRAELGVAEPVRAPAARARRARRA
ncbi:MAG TPA: FliA/WhiG family RNA polymerase sigma factor [Kofleriaceae bacterium]|nr:FliA/WhiG family RNA polymerase sigma factor [Kofleriaceae bacterium]